MNKEIGSNFSKYDLSLNERTSKFWWENGLYKIELFKSGRNAIRALCKMINTKNKCVLLPMYTCETVIQPFQAEGWDIYYYCVEKDLTINVNSFVNLVNQYHPDVVYVHSYFGMDTLENANDVLKAVKKRGILIVEDITQSLFSSHKIDFADYYVSSLRKFFAIPDGGIIISKNRLSIVKSDSSNKIDEIAMKAFDLKESYLISGDESIKQSFRNQYVLLNSIISNNDVISDISPISKLIFNTLNIECICERRKSNYKYLYNNIRDIHVVMPVFSFVADDCPLYFPVYVKDEKRADLQNYLAKNHVYCPIIWPRPSQVLGADLDVKYMYENMLCIPIDQRYGEEDMDRIVVLLNEYNKIV